MFSKACDRNVAIRTQRAITLHDQQSSSESGSLTRDNNLGNLPGTSPGDAAPTAGEMKAWAGGKESTLDWLEVPGSESGCSPPWYEAACFLGGVCAVRGQPASCKVDPG